MTNYGLEDILDSLKGRIFNIGSTVLKLLLLNYRNKRGGGYSTNYLTRRQRGATE